MHILSASRAGGSPGLRSTLADRLASARRARFVGRGDVLALFDRALRAPEPPVPVLFVHGPGGVGKSTLLHAFSDRARIARAQPLFVDGKDIEPSPRGFLLACGVDPDAGPDGGWEAAPVLLVDTYELLEPIDAWLRRTLLPRLPATAVVVLAGRKPPSEGWRADPGWSGLMQVVPLAALPADRAPLHTSDAVRVRSPELFVQLDRSRPRGLRAQVEDGVREAIRSGRLVPGARLPSSRALAHDLGVTRGLVVTVYEQLTAEGYLVSQRGSGTIVSPDVVPAGEQRPVVRVEAERLLSFTPAHPDLRLFPRRAWARAFRSAWLTLPDDALGSGDPLGLPVLRSALADYLGRVRGVVCEPEQVVVCSGRGQAFELVARTLAGLGHATVGLEDPGDRDLVPLVEREGLAALPLPVDDEGLRVERLEASGARAVVVSPASQFPLGVVLSPARRRRLCEWARRCDGAILEDDCEAEFRHDGQPIGALQGDAPDRVVYFGATGQSLAPGLRIAWLVVPPPFVDTLAAAGIVPAALTSAIVQATCAEFLARGDLDRHLHTVRKAYARRREALVAALERWFPGARTTGVAAGLHVLVRLPDGMDAERIATAATARGVEVATLAGFRADPGADPEGHPAGLVLGYASLTPSQIHAGIEQLAETAREVADRKWSP